MPPGRQSRASTAATSSKPKNARQKSQKRTLDAFSIAAHQFLEKPKGRKSRLGEAVSDGQPRKRRRVQDDDDDNDDDNDDEDEDENGRGGKRRTRYGADDDIEEGSDSEGNEWRIGGPIGDDSDSSLNSDEAFGESDEERFEGFTFRGSAASKKDVKKKKQSKARRVSAEMDLDEGSSGDDGEDDEDDDFGDEGVDLATMLDYNSEEEDEQPKKKSKKTRDDDDDVSSAADDEEDDDDDDDEEEEDQDSDDEPPSEAESDDDADPSKLSKLQDLIASLDADQPEKRLANRAPDVHESQQPSAFGLSATQKLKISDLLPTVTDPSLRKSLKLLSSDKPSKRSAGPGKLDAPLPKRQQDKLDREAATKKAKEELDKWRDTVIHNRRAEFLQFPLKDPNASEPLGKKTMIAVQQTQPQNDLESAIQNILVESGLGAKGKRGEEEAQMQEFEELKMNKIPIEEVMARRADLRKARELLFREEAKAKRIKKIKSKAYRRVHRRERERDAAKDQEFKDAEGIETDEDEQEKRDRKRAEERMSTKHRDSKWAKGMKKSGRTVWDDDARDSMMELARRNEHLRKRIEGKDVRERDSDDSDVSDEDDDEDDDDDMDDDEASRKRLSKNLEKLGQGDKEHSRLGNMLFMQRADAARRAQNEEEIQRLKRELADMDSASDKEDADTTVGRRTFGPKAKNGAVAAEPQPARTEMEENLASDEEDTRVIADDNGEAEIIVDRPATNSASAAKARKARPLMATKPTNAAPKEPETNGDDDANEWLSTSIKKSNKKNKNKTNEDAVIVSTKAVPAAAGGKKQSKAAAAAASTDGWTYIPHPNASATTAPPKDSAAEDPETSNPMLSHSSQQAAFHARAFAHDDTTASTFADEKADMATLEGPQETSTHLPGWGSWAGTGLSKATRKHNARIAHNPLFKTISPSTITASGKPLSRAQDRRDATLKNVIISEAQQRKGKKYLATSLPHEFERGDQYERSLRIPMGPEWVTKETHQSATRPRVVTKRGTVIEAMEKPLV